MKTKIYALAETSYGWTLSLDNQELFATKELAVEKLKKHYKNLVENYKHYLDVGYVFKFKECRTDEYTIDIEHDGKPIKYRGEIQELEVQGQPINVEKGHSYEEYMSKYGEDYRNGDLWDFSKQDLLDNAVTVDPDRIYWEIEVDGEIRYFETNE